MYVKRERLGWMRGISLPHFLPFGESRSRGNIYVVGMGKNRTLTYAKKMHTNAGALDAGYQYKTQNLLITLCGSKGKEEKIQLFFLSSKLQSSK